jgi:nucleotide-binding universal stress UspA family protein
MAFEKILIAFDNSDTSKVALQKACDLAAKFESELTALFVSTDTSDLSFQDSKRFLEDFSSSKGIQLNIVEKKGKVYDEVIKLEKEGNFALIIIGTHGKSGWTPFWMGSNAFKVVSSSTCPVISISKNAAALQLENILLPLADSNTTRQKVPYAAMLAKAFGATVHILGVSKSDSKDATSHVTAYVRQTERYLAERGVKYTVDIQLGKSVPETCIEYGAKVNASLLLIMTETESSGVFMDTYSQQLVNSSPIPVMSVHSRDTRIAGAAGY